MKNNYKTLEPYKKSEGIMLCIDFIREFPSNYTLVSLKYGYYKSKSSIVLKDLDLKKNSSEGNSIELCKTVAFIDKNVVLRIQNPKKDIFLYFEFTI